MYVTSNGSMSSITRISTSYAIQSPSLSLSSVPPPKSCLVQSLSSVASVHNGMSMSSTMSCFMLNGGSIGINSAGSIQSIYCEDTTLSSRTKPTHLGSFVLSVRYLNASASGPSASVVSSTSTAVTSYLTAST